MVIPGPILLNSPASLTSWATARPVRGVCSANFITTVLPVARAGPSFHALRRDGKKASCSKYLHEEREVPWNDLPAHPDRLMPEQRLMMRSSS